MSLSGPRVRHPLPPARWPTREAAAGSRWFSPIRIGRSLTALERTWVPAMVPWRATDDGLVTPEVLDWYARFADRHPRHRERAATAHRRRSVRSRAAGPRRHGARAQPGPDAALHPDSRLRHGPAASGAGTILRPLPRGDRCIARPARPLARRPALARCARSERS